MHCGMNFIIYNGHGSDGKKEKKSTGITTTSTVNRFPISSISKYFDLVFISLLYRITKYCGIFHVYISVHIAGLLF
jgi:hypothetical protein